MHRRPSGLLRMLVEAPNFRYSTQMIELGDQVPMAVRDFCVELDAVTPQYENQFRAYWGELTGARADASGALWLNSGGPQQMSFVLQPQHEQELMARYRLRNREEFSGAYILVLGEMNISMNGKMYCRIENLDMVALR